MMLKTSTSLHHARTSLLRAILQWFKGTPTPRLRYGGINPLKAFHHLHRPYPKKIFFIRRRRRLLVHNLQNKGLY